MEINYKYMLLGIFVILAFYLTTRYITQPNIGYHAMKTGEYYAETLFMNQNHEFLNRYTWIFFGLDEKNHHFDEYPQAPIFSWLTLPIWLITGEQLWVMRIINILFLLGSIIIIYFVTKEFTNNEYISLLSSFLMSIMPVGTYFSQAVIPDIPAMMFTLLATYFFIKWIKSWNNKYILYSMLAVSMAGIFKLTFMIILVPLFFMIPFKKLFYQPIGKTIKQIGISILGLIPFGFMTWLMTYLIVDKSRMQIEAFSIGFARIVDVSYWQKILPSLTSYVSDNFTMWFFLFTLIGICLVLTKYKTLLGKYVIGNLIAIVIYVGITSGKLGGHSFYAIPFLPLVCIMSAYLIFNIGMMLKDNIKVKYIEYITLILILITIPSVQQSNDRVFGTLFPGQDVLGQWLLEHKEPDSRLFAVATSQTYAVCTYSRMYCGEWTNESNMKYLENIFNIKYIYIDVYRLQDIQENKAWNYIKNNYKIKLVGLISGNNQLNIYAMILEKGGKFNITDIQNKQPYLVKTYDTPYGGVPYYVIEVDE